MRRKEGGVGRTEPLAIDDANFHPLFSLSLFLARVLGWRPAGGVAPTHFIHHRTLAVAHIQLARARPPPSFPFRSVSAFAGFEGKYVRTTERANANANGPLNLRQLLRASLARLFNYSYAAPGPPRP